MGHSVQLIIGRDPAIARVLAAWPQAKGVTLAAGWTAIAVNEALFDAIAAASPNGRKVDAFDSAPIGLVDALEAATARGGMLAYVETEYFGGTGSQSAGAWIDGKMQATERSRGIGAINSALRLIGVIDAAGKDAFDTLGLGERRKMSDYDAYQPATGKTPETRFERASASPPALPIWVALLVAGVAVTVGIAVSIMAL